jgi:hypothetical protein
MKSETFTTYGADQIVIETGGQPVVIDKLFGPASVCRVKVTLDLQAGQWVVFREVDGEDDPMKVSTMWVEAARFGCSDDTAPADVAGPTTS